MSIEKFIIPFIDFIDKYYDMTDHKFIFMGKEIYEHGLKKDHAVVWVDRKKDIGILIKEMNKATKIIIHGLWSRRFMKILFLQPWLYKKCYWVMYGGDFYFPEKQTWLKKQTIKRIGHMMSTVKGDYELVKKWYGATGTYHNGSIYTTNLYKEYDIEKRIHSTINIQVGNSANPTNNHLEVFEKLKKYKDKDIKIIVPLSYGGEVYAKKVIEEGKKIFGDKLVPLTEFMPFDQYLNLLAEIDIAIFNHNRQQALGNTITLLGLGKKVYMRSDVTTWHMFKEKNIKVYDVGSLNLILIDDEVKMHNQKNVKEIFSEENLKKRLNQLFYDKEIL